MTQTLSKDRIIVTSPLDGSQLETVSIDSATDLDTKVQQAKAAFPKWKRLTLKKRAEIFYTYRNLLATHRDELSELVHKENGKTLGEAMAEVDKAIEVTEFACSMPQMAVSESLEVSSGVFCTLQLDPVGVVSSITPFNFPVMVPHWTIPIALVLGNCMLLKASEKVPLSAIRCAELLKEAGVPEGVFQIVNGEKESVEAICDHPDIKAVSFVGSSTVAKIVYARATATGKRALCLGGAKNHLIVLPDANVEMTADNVVASYSGCAGQRCMAASVMVGVGDIDAVVKKITTLSEALVPGQCIGSVISAEAKARIERYITEAEAAGATLLVDGRNTTVAGKEGGYYVGPTVIDNVTPDMDIAKAEVFGPVLSIIRCQTVNEAIAIENASNYGNGASVYTQDGGLADTVSQALEAGMVGINIGIPVPREPFSFGGWHDSRFGVGDITGKSSIQFWTQAKKITKKWNAKDQVDWMS